MVNKQIETFKGQLNLDSDQVEIVSKMEKASSLLYTSS